ncbi:UNC93-like protein MFSD11 isoform X2 [Xenia sp. Carnegie-2017]|uniref:UNC93-like protein MFSD11 isoform X2 n=1 Tax=Xenia sp. Carnegie-2017 TaxID=2897299 RepID=UPI001F0374D4|nr:UNC93-like protein MFSD11 isoform X2 [Xenia sp. Carnegie-2017]XP_046855256.1 UNC93-like protein MFSD11 isoform X2 [Xenia sp. Carnegie-2017]
MADVRDYNVLILSLSFMFIFTAFQTTTIIEESILKSAKNESHHPSSFKASGYTSLCIIYASFSLFNWIAPPVISMIGSKFSMMLGGFCYLFFIFSLYFVSKYVKCDLSGLLYAASVVVGFGAAVIWTAQGSYLTLNSTDETMGRNSGIFWAFFQCSFLIGSMIVYFCFKPENGSTLISLHQRSIVLLIFIALSAFGTLFFLLLRKQKSSTESDRQEILVVNTRDSGTRTEKKGNPKKTFVNSLKLFITRPMFFLNVVFIYTGLELTFYSGVYGTSIGNTLHFSESKRLIGLCGVFIGVGEILGGGIFGIFGKRISAKGRDSAVFLGLIVHYVAFFLILLNLPDESPNGSSHRMGYLIQPSVYIAMFCAFLLGFGDSCFNTQIYSLLGNFYSDDSASAFAIFKFSQSVAAAVGFFYSSYLGLKFQLYILMITGFLATISFFVVEKMTRSRPRYQAF